MSEKKSKLVSPCISICQYPKGGTCLGCFRTSEDRKKWKDPNTSDEWKEQNITNIQKKMSHIHKKSWRETYRKKIQKINRNEPT